MDRGTQQKSQKQYWAAKDRERPAYTLPERSGVALLDEVQWPPT